MADIVYVEGDDGLRALYAECLRQAGFSVREARFATDGLHTVREVAPDLVVLEVAMPPGEMSGTELLARLREDHASAALPIIVFSRLGNILNPEFVMSLRVAAVVPKPAPVAHLVEVVRRVLAGGSPGGISPSEPDSVPGSRRCDQAEVGPPVPGQTRDTKAASPGKHEGGRGSPLSETRAPSAGTA